MGGGIPGLGEHGGRYPRLGGNGGRYPRLGGNGGRCPGVGDDGGRSWVVGGVWGMMRGGRPGRGGGARGGDGGMVLGSPGWLGDDEGGSPGMGEHRGWGGAGDGGAKWPAPYVIYIDSETTKSAKSHPGSGPGGPVCMAKMRGTDHAHSRNLPIWQNWHRLLLHEFLSPNRGR